MKIPTPYKRTAALASLALYVGSAWSQQTMVHNLQCNGSFQHERAQITGQRIYQTYNRVGDGTVRFAGVLRSPSGEARIQYGGYTKVGFEGRLDVTAGPYRGQTFAISVLDNTSGRFLIYRGGESLGAPDQWGSFVCSWVQQ